MRETPRAGVSTPRTSASISPKLSLKKTKSFSVFAAASRSKSTGAPTSAAIADEGIQFLLDTRTTRVENKNGAVTLSLEGPAGSSNVTGSHLLIAAGRGPNTDDLGLDKAGVETDKNGFIKVNGRLETNVPGGWALGDCKGGPAFTHISYNDFQIVYGNLVEATNLTTENRLMPYSVFADPQPRAR